MFLSVHPVIYGNTIKLIFPKPQTFLKHRYHTTIIYYYFMEPQHKTLHIPNQILTFPVLNHKPGGNNFSSVLGMVLETMDKVYIDGP